jgi:hypothetical protein
MQAIKPMRFKRSDLASTRIWWVLFGLSAWMFVLQQLVTVRPYPNLKRDSAIWSIALGLAALVFLFLGVSSHWKAVRKRDRLANGKCGDCGYDLNGNISGACPECGETIR